MVGLGLGVAFEQLVKNDFFRHFDIYTPEVLSVPSYPMVSLDALSHPQINELNYASAYFGPGGGLQSEGYPLPSSRLGSSFSRFALAATNP